MSAKKPPASPFPRSPPHDRRFPFQVRMVDRGRRCYSLVTTLDWYADACLAADVGVVDTGEDFVVWDTLHERVLYDSRHPAIKRRLVAQRGDGS